MLKVFKYLLFLTLLVGQAQAQVAAGGAKASSGTLMGAVLEQVGYHAQSQVLTQLRDQIEWAAALIYLCIVFSAIMTVALLGNYKSALWILVGPPMFIYMSGIEMGGQKNTTKGASVEWRFGAFKDPAARDDKVKTLKDSEFDPRKEAEVSFVFHKYNEMISEMFQYLITLITSNDTKSQMMFMARTQMMEELFDQQGAVPGLVALGQYFMLNCNREIAYASYVAQGLRDPGKKRDPHWQVAKDRYCKMFTEKKEFEPGPWQNYLFSLDKYKGRYIDKSDNQGAQGKQESGFISCQEMWEGMMDGARRGVLGRMEEAQYTAILPQAWAVSGAKTYNDVLAHVREKLTKADSRTDEEDQKTEKIDCINATASDFESDADVLANLFGAYLIKKFVVTSPFASMISRVSDRDHGVSSEQTLPLGSEPQAKEASFRRQGAHQYSETRKYEAIALINILPFLQGTILYVLAVLYPFFCLMLILPGQAGAFLTWMALWAWAKSWDVGWAFVMVADEILWELMPKDSFIDAEKSIEGNNAISMLEIVFRGDHSYNTATYWLLLSGMVGGVPVITANMILGAKKAVSGVLLSSFTSLADPFSSGAADWVSGAQGNMHTVNRGNAYGQNVVQTSMGEMANGIQQQGELNKGNVKGSADELANVGQTVNNNNQEIDGPIQQAGQQGDLPDPKGN